MSLMTIALVSRENEDGSESIEIHLDEKLDLCLVSIFDDAIAANFDLHREKRFFSLTQDPDRTSCSTTEKFLDNISTNQWKPSGSTCRVDARGLMVRSFFFKRTANKPTENTSKYEANENWSLAGFDTMSKEDPITLSSDSSSDERIRQLELSLSETKKDSGIIIEQLKNDAKEKAILVAKELWQLKKGEMEKAAQHYAENQVLESRNTESQKIEDKIKNVISKLMTDHTREMEKLNREHDQEREKMLDKCIDLDSARETAELKAIKLEEQLVEMEKDIIATKHQLAVAVGTSHEVGQSDDLDTVQEKEPSRYMDALELAIFSGEWSLVKTASAQLRVRIASNDKKINIAQQEVAAEVHLLHTQAARANATAEAMARSIWEERKTEVKAVTKWSVMSEIVPKLRLAERRAETAERALALQGNIETGEFLNRLHTAEYQVVEKEVVNAKLLSNQKELASKVSEMQKQISNAQENAERVAQHIWQERKGEVKAAARWQVMMEMNPKLKKAHRRIANLQDELARFTGLPLRERRGRNLDDTDSFVSNDSCASLSSTGENSFNSNTPPSSPAMPLIPTAEWTVTPPSAHLMTTLGNGSTLATKHFSRYVDSMKSVPQQSTSTNVSAHMTDERAMGEKSRWGRLFSASAVKYPNSHSESV